LTSAKLFLCFGYIAQPKIDKHLTKRHDMDEIAIIQHASFLFAPSVVVGADHLFLHGSFRSWTRFGRICKPIRVRPID
jgi:hypothetical protein